MANAKPQTQGSELLEPGVTCTLEELSLSCRVEPDWIAALVEEGALEAMGSARSDWAFAQTTIVRVAKARRLERDFGLSTPGIALALDLLDEIETLKARLRRHGLE